MRDGPAAEIPRDAQSACILSAGARYQAPRFHKTRGLILNFGTVRTGNAFPELLLLLLLPAAGAHGPSGKRALALWRESRESVGWHGNSSGASRRSILDAAQIRQGRALLQLPRERDPFSASRSLFKAPSSLSPSLPLVARGTMGKL